MDAEGLRAREREVAQDEFADGENDGDKVKIEL